jgi:O-glycosyl hydrolase
MWSRFVRPGAYRVSTSGSVSSVAIGAFKNKDGSVAVVFTNSGSSAQNVKLAFSGFTPSAASAYLTDNTHQVASTTATLSGGAVTVAIPARAIVSVTLTGSS